MEYLAKKSFSFRQDFAFTSINNKSYTNKWNILQKSLFFFLQDFAFNSINNETCTNKWNIFIAWEPRRPVTLLNYVQYIHYSNCHPPGVKRGFLKGEALRLLRTNSSKTLFEESVTNFKTHLLERGYAENFIQTTLSEVTFEDRNQALRQKQKQKKEILPFVTQYHPAVPNVKLILINSWYFITQQPLLNDIFKEPP